MYQVKFVSFLLYFIQTLLNVLVFSFLVSSFLMLSKGGHDFIYYWRYWHDHMFNIFWYIVPLLFLLNLLSNYDNHLLAKIINIKYWSRWLKVTAFTFISVTAGFSLSQLFGGCIWLVFTEGWDGNWYRFGGHDWSPIRISQQLLFTTYLFLTVVSFKWAYTFYLRYILSKT